MIHNWLKPVDPDDFSLHRLRDDQVGRHVRLFGAGVRSLRRCRVALIGADAEVARLVRPALYRLSWHFGKEQLFDLGDVHRAEVEFLIPLLRELLESRIFPLLIGGAPHLVQAQYQAFQELRNHISLAVIDEEIALSAQASRSRRHFLNPAVHARRHPIYHLAHIGAQAHHVPPDLFSLMEQRHFELVRLGRARAELAELEPVIRDADLVSLNLAALKYADAPAQGGHNPSGFLLEEACQISRYAGMSDKLQSCGFYGFVPKGQPEADEITAQAAAQLVWYFLDGFFNRKGDYPVSNEGLTEYIVDFKDFEQITFWKSTRSGRWWIQAPVDTPQGYQRHRLIPCSYNDYLLACQGELPERLINAFKRFA